MSFVRIVPQLWMQIPVEERAVIAEGLGIERTGASEVFNEEIVSDGYTMADLGNVTIEKMADWTGYTMDDALPPFHRLWELTIAKAHSIVNPPEGVLASGDGAMHIEEVPAAIDLSQFKEVSNEEMAAIKAGEVPNATAVAEPAPEVIAKPKSNAKATQAPKVSKKAN